MKERAPLISHQGDEDHVLEIKLTSSGGVNEVARFETKGSKMNTIVKKATLEHIFNYFVTYA